MGRGLSGNSVPRNGKPEKGRYSAGVEWPCLTPAVWEGVLSEGTFSEVIWVCTAANDFIYLFDSLIDRLIDFVVIVVILALVLV